ncbi:MAG TPA: RNA-binding domain-containing protein [Candidatus Thermoplasmatota archaeon]|nr:RNA-binding domain-containing protein [Candidatus Thermoplasmatota archaeon]
MIVARVSAAVQPTEDPALVERAVRAFFPGAALETTGARVAGSEEGAKGLAEAIARAKIADTARAILLGNLSRDERTTAFEINKQAAVAGRLNFATVRGPLGDIVVRLEADAPEELRAFIDRAAPDTRAKKYREALSPADLRELLRAQRREWTPEEMLEGSEEPSEPSAEAEEPEEEEGRPGPGGKAGDRRAPADDKRPGG